MLFRSTQCHVRICTVQYHRLLDVLTAASGAMSFVVAVAVAVVCPTNVLSSCCWACCRAFILPTSLQLSRPAATCEVRRRLWYYSTATLAAQLPFFVWLLVYFLFTCMILICFLSDSCLLRSHPIPQEIHYLTVHFTPTHLVPFQRNYGTRDRKSVV